MYELSVEDAIRKGQRLINWPITFIIIIVGGGLIFAAKENNLPGWTLLAGIALAIVLAWLYWSIMIVRWRLWAFDKVHNVHELYKRAITEHLIWPDGSWATKTEIWTKEQREQWVSIQSRFSEPDVLEDDYTVPAETSICFSRSRNLAEMTLMLLLAGFGIYLIVADINLFFGIVMVAIGVIFAIRELKQATNTKPQIVLNQKGITTVLHGFEAWHDIIDADVILERRGKSQHACMVYTTKSGRSKVSIEDLETTRQQLFHLLRVYRGRAMRKKS